MSMLSAGMACMLKAAVSATFKKPARPVACAFGPGSVEPPYAARRPLIMRGGMSPGPAKGGTLTVR